MVVYFSLCPSSLCFLLITKYNMLNHLHWGTCKLSNSEIDCRVRLWSNLHPNKDRDWLADQQWLSCECNCYSSSRLYSMIFTQSYLGLDWKLILINLSEVCCFPPKKGAYKDRIVLSWVHASWKLGDKTCLKLFLISIRGKNSCYFWGGRLGTAKQPENTTLSYHLKVNV